MTRRSSTASRSAASGKSRSSAATPGASLSTRRQKSSMTCASSSMATTFRSISTANWWFGGFGRDNAPAATITLPALESDRVVRCFAALVLGLRRRAPRRLFLGCFRDRGRRQSLRRVRCSTLSGAGNADLDEVLGDQCRRLRQRRRERRLNMTGGRLTGEMSGAGNLVYLGTVSEQSVYLVGFVNIRRVDGVSRHDRPSVAPQSIAPRPRGARRCAARGAAHVADVEC